MAIAHPSALQKGGDRRYVVIVWFENISHPIFRSPYCVEVAGDDEGVLAELPDELIYDLVNLTRQRFLIGVLCWARDTIHCNNM
jgi:hypothetical protein